MHFKPSIFRFLIQWYFERIIRPIGQTPIICVLLPAQMKKRWYFSNKIDYCSMCGWGIFEKAGVLVPPAGLMHLRCLRDRVTKSQPPKLILGQLLIDKKRDEERFGMMGRYKDLEEEYSSEVWNKLLKIDDGWTESLANAENESLIQRAQEKAACDPRIKRKLKKIVCDPKPRKRRKK